MPVSTHYNSFDQMTEAFLFIRLASFTQVSCSNLNRMIGSQYNSFVNGNVDHHISSEGMRLQWRSHMPNCDWWQRQSMLGMN